MKILFIVPYVPSLVRTRPYNLIRGLTERGHQVTVLTLWANEQEWASLERLKQHCHHVQAMHMPSWRSWWNCIRALPEGVPLQSVFSWRPELVAHLNGNSTFDVVHVEHLRGARYGLHLKSQNHLPVVWDSVDSITHLFRQAAAQSKNLIGRMRSRLDLKRTERYEGWLLDKFDHVTVTSPVDKDALVSLNTNGTRPAPISVLRNGVDLSYFSPIPTAVRKPATLVVSGKMSYHANVTMVLHLVRNIMPYIWARRPDVELWIVGKDPTREVEALGQNPAITVTGMVADIRPYLRQATIAVAPVTYGAGVQNKVLEAMACATPVVATPRAILALQAVPGRDLWVADEPSTFANSVLRLLNDPAKRQRLGEAGRSYVEVHHDWTNIAGRLEQIYSTAIHLQGRD
jgi:sugar transferase (PEP-CTERM/EpsH1 system associated)